MGNKTSDGEPFLFSCRVVSRGFLAYNKQTSYRVEEQTKVFVVSFINAHMFKRLICFVLPTSVLAQLYCVTNIWPYAYKAEKFYN